MEKHVSVRWRGDLDFSAASDGSVTLSMGVEGDVDAFRPAALLLVGLAGCTGMDAISIMTKKRQQIDSYQLDVVGQQRDEHPRYFTSIEVTHIIEGQAIDDVAIERAIELSACKYCVVGANLALGPTAINHRMRIIDGQGERSCDCLTIGPAGAGLANPVEPSGQPGEG